MSSVHPSGEANGEAPDVPVHEDLEQATAINVGTTEDEKAREKWTRVRSQAMVYLKERKDRWVKLSTERQHRLKEVLIYFTFAIFVTVVALTQRETDEAHFLAAGMREFLMGSEFPPENVSNWQKSFEDMVTVDDLWFYLQGVVPAVVYSGGGNGTNNPILGNNMIVGPVRVRQVRIKPTAVDKDGCNVPPLIKKLGSVSCYFKYDSDDADTESPVAVWEDTLKTAYGGRTLTESELSWMKYKEANGFAFQNSVLQTSYSTDGYSMVLPPGDKAAAQKMLHDAKTVGWINRNSTRAVFFEITLYNPNLNMFLTASLVAELPASSGVVPIGTYRVVNLYRWGRVGSLAGLILECIVFGFVVFYMVIEYRNIKRQGFKNYIKQGFNVITLLNLILFVVVIILEIVTLTSANTLLNGEPSDLDGYELQKVAFFAYQVSNWNAFNALLTWMRLIKYLDVVSKKTKQLSDTIGAAGFDVLVFLVLFGILYFGFAVAFYISFGQEVFEFRSIGDALFSLFRTLLGDFDFEALRRANRILGPILFVAFICIIFFCLLNMFLAIIMKAYDEVTAKLQEDPDELSVHMRRLFRKKMGKWFGKKYLKFFRIKPAQEDDATLTEKELQRIWDQDSAALKGLGITDYKEMVEIADNEIDGGLSLEEILTFARQKAEEAEDEAGEQEVPYLLMKLLERTNAIMNEQKQVRAMLQSGGV